MKRSKFYSISIIMLFIFLFTCSYRKIYYFDKNYAFNPSLNNKLKTSSVKTIECEFYKKWGQDYHDTIAYIAQDSEGNFIITGTTSDQNWEGDIFILKYDITGKLLWSKIWGTNENDGLGYNSFVIDLYNNIYLAGIIHNGTDSDIFLLKFDSSGTLLWNYTWGGFYYDSCNSIITDYHGNLYCTGSSSSLGNTEGDLYLMKINSSGGLQWVHPWKGKGINLGLDLVMDSSGNIYVVGLTENTLEKPNVVLLKYDTSGSILWNQTWLTNTAAVCDNILLDSYGDIYLPGTIDTGGGGMEIGDIFILKYNTQGILKWYDVIGGPDSEHVWASTIDNSNNIYITGYAWISLENDHFPFLVKYDTEGDLIFFETVIETPHAETYDISMDSSNDIILVGYQYPNTLLIKYNKSGTLKWNYTWEQIGYQEAEFIIVDQFDQFYVAGHWRDTATSDLDIFFAKFSEADSGSLDGFEIVGYNSILVIFMLALVSLITGIHIASRILISRRIE